MLPQFSPAFETNLRERFGQKKYCGSQRHLTAAERELIPRLSMVSKWVGVVYCIIYIAPSVCILGCMESASRPLQSDI